MLGMRNSVLLLWMNDNNSIYNAEDNEPMANICWLLFDVSTFHRLFFVFTHLRIFVFVCTNHKWSVYILFLWFISFSLIFTWISHSSFSSCWFFHFSCYLLLPFLFSLRSCKNKGFWNVLTSTAYLLARGIFTSF